MIYGCALSKLSKRMESWSIKNLIVKINIFVSQKMHRTLIRQISFKSLVHVFGS